MQIKTQAEIDRMRTAGILLWKTHQKAKELMLPGMTTAAIDAEVDRFIVDNGALALFKTAPGEVPYRWASCISVNETIVHGIPSERKIAEGDIVSIDIGLQLDGWCSDCAVTYAIGEVSDEKRKLMDVTEETLRIAIREIKPGMKWSKIAKQMAGLARRAGFGVVEELVGHGIGREMWEVPQVPNYAAFRLPDFTLREGMVICVEPMINAGTRKIRFMPDKWSINTADGKPSAHFEQTIAVTAKGARVLSCGPNGEGWAL